MPIPSSLSAQAETKKISLRAVPSPFGPAELIESPSLGPPINNIGDGLNGGSEKVGAGCAELNSGYNARCRSFEMYESCISCDPVEGEGEEGRTGEQEVESGRREESRMKEGGVDRMWWLAGRQLPQSSIFRAWLRTQSERDREIERKEGERGSEREGRGRRRGGRQIERDGGEAGAATGWQAHHH